MDPATRNLLVLAAAALVFTVGLAYWWWRRRRAAQAPMARLARASDAVLTNVLLPHTETGQIHIAMLLRHRAGISVVDLREARGHVFGSEAMQEWTVLDGSRRYTFANPLPLLYDRVAAVRRVVPDVAVRGLVVFTAGAQFSKGYPPHVSMLDALVAELDGIRAAPHLLDPALVEQAWQTLARDRAAA
jgi:hypothetical protein